MSRRLSSCLVLASALLLGAGSTAAYDLVTLDGRVREAESVQFAGKTCIVTAQGAAETLPASEVDYYETFKRNAESGAGNVVVFKSGAFFRFESFAVQNGRVVLGLGDQGKVSVPEQTVDFEQSVQEAATVRLPRAAARFAVAKSRGGGSAGSASGGGSDEERQLDRRNRSRADLRSGNTRLPSSSQSRRQAALRQAAEQEAGNEPFQPESLSLDDNEDSQPPDGDADAGGADDAAPTDRDGMTDPEEVRRRADERGEQTGAVSVIISSQDSLDVAAVQFRLRYPSNCVPAGAQTIGAFANASMAQPNGSVGGRPLMAMAIVYAPDATTSLPGDIARIDFTWTGNPPTQADFAVVGHSATDTRGNALRGFRAEATLLQ